MLVLLAETWAGALQWPMCHVTNFPVESTAIQNVGDVQEMDARGTDGSTATIFVEEVPSQEMALPATSTAVQSVALTQEREAKGRPGSIASGPDQILPFQVNKLPFVSTAAQKPVPTQDADVRVPPVVSTVEA
ncbi:MAG: hypothetical protein M0Z87_11250 [Actinomycetota bacterium]|nr:hypothetical protein [Actinomycetota bacterium]